MAWVLILRAVMFAAGLYLSIIFVCNIFLATAQFIVNAMKNDVARVSIQWPVALAITIIWTLFFILSYIPIKG